MEEWSLLAPEIYSRVPVMVVYPWRSGTGRAVPTKGKVPTDTHSVLAGILRQVSDRRIASFRTAVTYAKAVPYEKILERWRNGLYSGELMRAWPLQQRILARSAQGMVMTEEDDVGRT